MISIYNIMVSANATAPVDTGYTFVKGDSGQELHIKVNGVDLSGTAVKIGFDRPGSASPSVESTDVTLENDTYIYVFKGNELSFPGRVRADLKFYSGDRRVSTASFLFDVVPDTLDSLHMPTAPTDKDPAEGIYEEMLELRDETAGYAAAAEQSATNAAEEAQTAEESAQTAEAAVEEVQRLMTDIFNPRGVYNPATTYNRLDIIYTDTASYLVKQTVKGVQPPNDTYYQLLVSGSSGTVDWTAITDKPSLFPPEAHTHSGADIVNMTGYVKATNAGAIAVTDTLYQAIGKLEEKTDNTQSSLAGSLIVASNVSVSMADWFSDTTFASFPYRAAVTVTGCTTDYVPDVCFEPDVAMSGKMCPVAGTGAGVVYVYTSELPSADINILSIVLRKDVG